MERLQRLSGRVERFVQRMAGEQRVNVLMLELMCDDLDGEAIIDAFTEKNITVRNWTHIWHAMRAWR